MLANPDIWLYRIPGVLIFILTYDISDAHQGVIDLIVNVKHAVLTYRRQSRRQAQGRILLLTLKIPVIWISGYTGY